MAAVPDEILGKKVFKKVRAGVFRYGVFAIIILELLCFLLKYLNIYTFWHYVLFTQLACMIFMLNNNYNLKPKTLCVRKSIAYNSLIAYYFLGFISVLFSISNNLYNNIASFALLFVSFILMILSYKNE